MSLRKSGVSKLAGHAEKNSEGKENLNKFTGDAKNSSSMAERIGESQTLERMNADSQMLEEGSNAETRT